MSWVIARPYQILSLCSPSSPHSQDCLNLTDFSQERWRQLSTIWDSLKNFLCQDNFGFAFSFDNSISVFFSTFATNYTLLLFPMPESLIFKPWCPACPAFFLADLGALSSSPCLSLEAVPLFMDKVLTSLFSEDINTETNLYNYFNFVWSITNIWYFPLPHSQPSSQLLPKGNSCHLQWSASPQHLSTHSIAPSITLPAQKPITTFAPSGSLIIVS